MSNVRTIYGFEGFMTGSGCGLFKVLSRRVPGGTTENGRAIRTARLRNSIRTRDLPSADHLTTTLACLSL